MHSRVKAACGAARFLQWEGFLRFTAARRSAAACTALCAVADFAALGLGAVLSGLLRWRARIRRAWRGTGKDFSFLHKNAL